MIQIREATTIAAREALRKSDYAHTAGSEDNLREYLRRSTVRMVAYVDEEPACVWGLAPQSLLSNQAYLWLLTTDLAMEHKFLLVRYSQLFVERALKHFEALTGHCEAGNMMAKRWVRWLGGEFGEPDGKNVPFVIRRK